MRATQAGLRLRAVTVIIALIGLASPAVAAKKAAAPDPVPEIIHGPYVVADVDTGRVIVDSDALRPWYPASTSKLMTIYVTFRAIQAGEITLDSQIRYGADAAAEPPAKMGFVPGTTLTLDNALKMMMVKSANDIAIAVADAVGGSVNDFAVRMNAESKRLGMTRSHWVNPNGLPDPGQVTTARDMAIVARALLTEFPQYRSYYNIPAIEIGGRVIKNVNSLIERYPGATGMKTGFICASGYNLIGSARRGDREVLAVVFGAYGGKARTERAAELLDQGFASPLPAAGAPVVTLAGLTSGSSYDTPADMRPLICGSHRKAIQSELNEEDEDDGSDTSHLTDLPLYFGAPIHVSAVAPIDYGDPAFTAPLPRARPGQPGEDVLNAYAPSETATGGTAPADAIGAAIGAAMGGASSLGDIAPQ